MKEIYTKEDLISHFAFETFCQAKNYYDIFWTWSNMPYMKNFINNYYPNFKDVLKDVKICLDMMLKQTCFFLEYARFKIIHYSSKIIEEVRKEVLNVIVSAYKKWIDTLLNDGVNMNRNTIYVDGFNRYINNQDILAVIDKDEDLKEVLESLSFSVAMINSDINEAISKIEILNEHLKYQKGDNEFNKKLVADVQTEYFTVLRNSIEKRDVDVKSNLREKRKDKDEDIINYYESQEENLKDNEKL